MSRSGPSQSHALVDRISSGDESAFEEMFRSQFAALAAYVFRIVRERDTAEDVAQSVLAELWTSRAGLPSIDSLTAFLRARARQRAIDVLRKEMRQEDFSASSDVLAAGRVASPHTAAESADLRAAIDTAMETLPPRARLIAIMRWEDGLSQSEIAAELRLSVRTINAQLVRAARPIRDILRSHYQG